MVHSKDVPSAVSELGASSKDRNQALGASVCAVNERSRSTSARISSAFSRPNSAGLHFCTVDARGTPRKRHRCAVMVSEIAVVKPAGESQGCAGHGLPRRRTTGCIALRTVGLLLAMSGTPQTARQPRKKHRQPLFWQLSAPGRRRAGLRDGFPRLWRLIVPAAAAASSAFGGSPHKT